MSNIQNVTDSFATVHAAFFFVGFDGKLAGCVTTQKGTVVNDLDVTRVGEDFLFDNAGHRYMLRKEQVEFIQ